MADDQGMRASDKDRDAVVAVLRDGYAAGRLTLDEFDERTSAAYRARTWGELRAITADLPEKAELGTDLRTPAAPVGPLPAPLPPPRPLAPVARSRPRSRSRALPIVVIWVIIGIAVHSPPVVAAALLVLPLSVLVSAFLGGWRDGDKDRR